MKWKEVYIGSCRVFMLDSVEYYKAYSTRPFHRSQAAQNDFIKHNNLYYAFIRDVNMQQSTISMDQFCLVQSILPKSRAILSIYTRVLPMLLIYSHQHLSRHCSIHKFYALVSTSHKSFTFHLSFFPLLSFFFLSFIHFSIIHKSFIIHKFCIIHEFCISVFFCLQTHFYR